MDARDANLLRKRLPCLRCARLFWTDRCHRVCARCQRLRRLHGVWDLISDLYRVGPPGLGGEAAKSAPKRKMG